MKKGQFINWGALHIPENPAGLLSVSVWGGANRAFSSEVVQQLKANDWQPMTALSFYCN